MHDARADELLVFRHRMRNIYAFQLDAEQLPALLDRLPVTWRTIQTDLEVFEALLRDAAEGSES